MKKILQLATYPIRKPLHGGQLRVSEIKKYFEKNNCIVKNISLSEMSHGYYDQNNDFLLEDDDLNKLTDIPFCTDYVTSLLSTQKKAYRFLKTKILDFKPDVILLEQPWLWPAVKKVLNENILESKPTIVYSSQNIEFKTKDSLLKSHNIVGKNVEKMINDIYILEEKLCIEADTVICCTKVDADEFKKMGAKQTLICNNGVSEKIIDKHISEQLVSDLNGRKYALFVGSAYPPNALGFWNMLGTSLAWLPPEYIIIAAGGVSNILENYIEEEDKLYSYVSLDKIKRVGFVSDELLASLLNNASVILLPITVGGGSNLKTAEAIASGKPVVATTTACRGFNIIEKLTNFSVTDKRDEFIKQILNFLNTSSFNSLTKDELLVRKGVYWENTLINLSKILKENK